MHPGQTHSEAAVSVGDAVNGDSHAPGHPDHHHPHEHPHSHGRATGRWWAAAGVLGVLLWSVSGIRIVGPAERGIVRRFGRCLSTQVPPGLHFGLPIGIERLTRIEVRRTRRVGVGIDLGDRAAGRLPDPDRTQFLTGDRNLVDLQLSVQYVIEQADAYAFAAFAPDSCVRLAAKSALCDVVRGMSVDGVLTLRKSELQVRVRQGAQAIVDELGIGVSLLSVSLERAAPPEPVADAFRDVTSARADRARKIAEAEGYRDDLLPRTRGEVSGLLEAARATAYATVEVARGRAERFDSVFSQARQAPALTRSRMHREVMTKALTRTRKVLVPSSGGTATDVRFIGEGP